MKIVSDFDGVMTDQGDEARYEAKLFIEKLAEVDDGAPDIFGLALAELSENATDYGWISEGRISAFADEDLFIQVIGCAAYFDQRAENGDARLTKILEGLKPQGYDRFEDVSSWAYGEMVKHTRAGEVHPMDPVVGEVLTNLLDAGHEVVVVSNSATDRVIELLESLSLSPVAHDVDPKAKFRVRGGAKKFVLGSQPQPFELDGRTFDADRPFYRTIIDEEVPKVVIGDVFSLDLALPWQLSQKDEALKGLKLLLRTQEYTPKWATDLAQSPATNGQLDLLSSFDQLPSKI